MCANRVKDDVAAEFQEMTFFLDKQCLEATLEDMSHPFVATIDRLRIYTIQLPHAGRKVPFRCLDQQMVVVGHKSVRVADPVLLLDGVIENGKGTAPDPCRSGRCLAAHYPVRSHGRGRRGILCVTGEP